MATQCLRHMFQTLGSHIVLECNVKSQTLGSRIVLEYNVKCKKLSIVPCRREETLENFEKELKKINNKNN